LSETSVIDADKRRRAVLIVIACTLIGATAQVLIKLGAAHLEHTGLVATAIGIFTIPTLFAGYFLYGIFTVLLVYALRDAELSILYPVIALSYVWVTLASVLIFHETMNLPKALGVAIIVLGVAVLGRGGTR
jgi:drug/metabolite transporter (DMT)-like permease